MSEAFRSDYRMTVEAFHAFLADRPDWEKWELIDGEAIVQATPTKRHQAIIGNLLVELDRLKEATQAPWHPLIGIGTRVSGDQHNEVLSPGSVRRDMVRMRAFYERIPSLTEYVVLAQDRSEATIFSRLQSFSPRRLSGDDQLELPSLGGQSSLPDSIEACLSAEHAKASWCQQP